jgi:predicted nucleic acid-binding protein
LNRFVLDASITLCWCFEDQATSFTEAILDLLAEGKRAIVPFIWPLEMSNALLSGERRKLLSTAQVTSIVEELKSWTIEIDRRGLDRAFSEILSVARTFRLTTYDAAYLELAMREALPLATLDKDLSKAARAAGIPSLDVAKLK